jgi:outer membrane protein assembly factor BamB
MSEPQSSGGTDGEYVAVSSFPLAACVAVAADADTVALAGRNAVEIVTADDRTTVDIDDEVGDVAVDRYVYVLTGDEIRALTVGGVSLWSTTVSGGTDVAPIRDEEVVVVATADGDLVGLDAETGGKLFRTTRPHSNGPEVEALVGGVSGVAVAAWTFLTYVDGDGKTVYDVNLDGAIKDVAIRGDQVVVALKGDDLVAIEADGSHAWSTSVAVDSLAPVADDQLLAVRPDGIYAVTDAGQMHPIDVADADQVVATTDGSLVCTVAAGEVTVYRPADEVVSTVSLSLATDHLTTAEPVVVRAANETDEDQSVTVGVRCDGVTVERGRKPVDLEPGETKTVEFAVTSLGDREEAEIVVERDGEAVLTETRPVEYSADASDVVDVSSSLAGVEAGTAIVAVTLENSGDRTVEGGTVRRADVSVPSLDPGGSARVEVPVGVEDEAVDDAVVLEDEQVGEVAVDLPPVPDVTIERVDSDTHPCIDVTVTNQGEVPWTESVIVTVAGGDPRIEREVTLAPGSGWLLTLQLADPPTSAFDVGVLFPQLDHERTVELDGWDAATHLETPAGRRQATGAHSEPSRRDDTARHAELSRSGQREDSTGSDTEREANTTGDQPSGATEDGPGAGATDEAADTGSTEEGATAGPTGTGGGDERTPLRVSRDVASTGTPAEVVTDRIAIRNDGGTDLADVTVEIGESTRTIDQLAPNDAVSLSRDVAFTRPGEQTLDGGRVRAGEHVASIEPVTVTVRESTVTVDASLDDGPSTVDVTFRVGNEGSERLAVQTLGIDVGAEDNIGVWEDVDDVPILEPGETATVRRQLSADRCSIPDGTTAVEALASYQTATGDEGLARTLAPATETTADTLDVSIVGETAVRGQLSMIELVVENDGRDPLSTVMIEASGAALEDSYYSPASIDTLRPGETLEHDVAIRPTEESTTSFELTIDGDGDLSHRYTVSGPVATTRAVWDDEMLAQWTVERQSTDGRDEPDLPDVDWIATSFSR